MKGRHVVLAKVSIFIGIALAVVALIVVRPALAQEDASSSPAVDPSLTSIESVSSPTTGAAATTSTETTADDSSSASSTPSDSDSLTNTAATPTPTSVSNATVSQTETPPAGLTEVHINGTKYIDYFSDGTTMSAYPGDPTIDSNLDKPNAPIPTHEGMTWVHTTGQPLYDTPSGDLELGDYAVLPSGFECPTFSEFNLNGSNSSDELPHGWFSDGDRDARHYNSDTNNDPERSGNHDAVTGLTTFSDQPRRPPSLPPCPSPLFGR